MEPGEAAFVNEAHKSLGVHNICAAVFRAPSVPSVFHMCACGRDNGPAKYIKLTPKRLTDLHIFILTQIKPL